jgi:hypothetical protein
LSNLRISMRVALIGIAVLAVISTACAGRSPAESVIERVDRDPELLVGDPFPLVQGVNYLGVIIPEDRVEDGVLPYLCGCDGFWTPTESDIGRVESGLRIALLSPNCERIEDRVLQDLDSYRRQYVGILVDGRRRILVNAFPGLEAGGTDWHYYWRHQYVEVSDGGYRYWEIQFEVSSGKYSNCSQHGYA